MPPVKKTPAAKAAGGRRINLNEVRAARAEKRATDAPIIEIGDQEFELPTEMPAEVAFALNDGDLRGALFALVGAEAAAALLAATPPLSVNDLEALFEVTTEVYGTDLGKPDSSDGS